MCFHFLVKDIETPLRLSGLLQAPLNLKPTNSVNKTEENPATET
jgi:hypothetical protein